MEPSQPTFSGLHVGAFESRRADEMARLIELSGGVAHVSPSVREAAVAGDAGAIDFVRRLIAGEVGAAIFLSGSGFQRLLSAAENHVGRRPYLAALRATVTIARGLKVAKAMGDASIRPTHTVAKPYTWREVLDTIDRQVPVEGRVVAVQEYGQPNPGLVVGLEARGARVLRVAIYRWELPDDTRPLEENVRRLAQGDLDVVLFTSAVQLMHVLLVARQLDLERPVRDMLQRCVVGSIGPMMSDALRGESLPVDVEAGDSKIGQLVRLAACHAADLRFAQTTRCRGVGTTGGRRRGLARALVRQSFHESMSLRADGGHARVADAAGRAVHGGLPRGATAQSVFSSCARIRRCAARSCARRSSGWASTRPSCSPTCCRFSNRWVWTWSLHRVAVRSFTTRCANRSTWIACWSWRTWGACTS